MVLQPVSPEYPAETLKKTAAETQNPLPLRDQTGVIIGTVERIYFDEERQALMGEARMPNGEMPAQVQTRFEGSWAAKLDPEKMEAAADRLVGLATQMGLNREEVASVCLAIAGNHMIATDVSEERAALGMIGMYRFRKSRGVPEHVLVPE